MKINKIILNNIGSYEGFCEFDFSINNPDKNVILIGGQNGAGKTSLFTSIKLALYGPLCFNYQGINHVYLNKIKNLINNNAYTKEEVSACISVNFSIIDEREICTYNIERSWKFNNKKLEENLTVYKNDRILNLQETTYFQNYIQTVLPPHLLDLYFFDGEELATFFSGTNTNSYLKDALLTLCDFDTFEHLRKYSSNYIRRNNSDDHLKIVQNNYDDHLNLINNMHAKIQNLHREIAKANDKVEELTIKKSELDIEYKKAGGLSLDEKNQLEKNLKQHEVIKERESYRVRAFIEELMPFIIVKDVAHIIKEQLDKETRQVQYKAISSSLNTDFIFSVLEKETKKNDLKIVNGSGQDCKTDFAHALIDEIRNQIKPDFLNKDFTIVHDFSSEDKSKIYGLIDSISNFQIESIVDSIKRKNESQKVTMQINQSIRSALSQEDLEKYDNKKEALNKNITSIEREKGILEYEVQEKIAQLEVLEKERKDLYNILVNSAQDKNIYDITSAISNMLEKFIINITKDKFDDLKENFINIFSDIIRKENFIDDIEIDDCFNVHLYRKVSLTVYEIGHLLNNLGLAEFIDTVGQNSISLLLRKFQIQDVADLQKSIDNYAWNDSLELYKKVNINQLSKGEKQIYILSLYGAMIRTSSHDIPFIIDTPYARIDTIHRGKITTSYFPTISSQVIILSTDEEVNEHYYKQLKPFIAHEYLLEYDKIKNKTTIRKNYFFEVK